MDVSLVILRRSYGGQFSYFKRFIWMIVQLFSEVHIEDSLVI